MFFGFIQIYDALRNNKLPLIQFSVAMRKQDRQRENGRKRIADGCALSLLHAGR
jgi:hypothetical protein